MTQKQVEKLAKKYPQEVREAAWLVTKLYWQGVPYEDALRYAWLAMIRKKRMN